MHYSFALISDFVARDCYSPTKSFMFLYLLEQAIFIYDLTPLQQAPLPSLVMEWPLHLEICFKQAQAEFPNGLSFYFLKVFQALRFPLG